MSFDPTTHSHLRTCKKCIKEFNAVLFDIDGHYFVADCIDCHGSVNARNVMINPYSRKKDAVK